MFLILFFCSYNHLQLISDNTKGSLHKHYLNLQFPISNYKYNYNTVSGTHHSIWYEDSIQKILSNRIMSNYSDGYFHGSDVVTRKEIVYAVYRLLIHANITFSKSTDQSDLPKDFVFSWSWPEVFVPLFERGIVKCYPDKYFRAKHTLNRAEMAQIVSRIIPLIQTNRNMIQTSAVFTDVPKSSWFAPAIEYTFQAGILKGYNDGLFRPKKTVTRYELAVLLARLIPLVVK